jgi:rare lipoprotein A (peptidoglycan hydrolase)
VLAPAPTGEVASETDVAVAGDEPRLTPIVDFPVASRESGPRPDPSLPNTVEVQVTVPSHPKLTGHHVAGSATWYCQTGVSACHHSYPGGMYAAAGPELRVGSWRGRQVRVCAGGECIWVRLIDWCACGGSHVIDLYSDAFRRLAPLNAGALRVTVSW